MLKFGQVSVASKDFYSTYQVPDSIDLGKITVSEGVVANKNDMRYTIGYEVEPGKVVPLYVKTPRDCSSSGVSRYNESFPWKMGFNVSKDLSWIERYEAIWWRICEFLHAPGAVVLNWVVVWAEIPWVMGSTSTRSWWHGTMRSRQDLMGGMFLMTSTVTQQGCWRLVVHTNRGQITTCRSSSRSVDIRKEMWNFRVS